jgi:penicillin-binding protein 2
MSRLIRSSEREGKSGIEMAEDARLSGRPGLRLIEHDKRARELRLWSSLQVAPGSDVQLTIDLDLQNLVEQQAKDCLQRMLHHPQVVPEKVDVAIALLDAGTGDVLAVSGAPLRVPATVKVDEEDPDTHEIRKVEHVEEMLRGQPPGLGWRGPGDVGSLAKPFVALEHLRAVRAGEPHKDDAAFEACNGHRQYGQRRLGCDHAHGRAGHDVKEALAFSCNNWFYQAAEGLGEAGVQSALARVGLVKPQCANSTLPEFVPMWSLQIADLSPATAPLPKLDRSHGVLRRAIGYGVQASAVSVARAYAALATGALPQSGLLLGERRPPLSLGVADADLEIVRAGLRACVDRGTAREVAGLRRWQVFGKTGTAEVAPPPRHDNNAWFAGWVPTRGEEAQLCFCAVVYYVPDGEHGAKVAGELVASVLDAIARDAELGRRYLRAEGPR